MTIVKILGTGCKNCTHTAKLLEEVATELGATITVEKITDLAQIMGYGALSTPGVVISEKLVHAGGVPSREQVIEWIKSI